MHFTEFNLDELDALEFRVRGKSVSKINRAHAINAINFFLSQARSREGKVYFGFNVSKNGESIGYRFKAINDGLKVYSTPNESGNTGFYGRFCWFQDEKKKLQLDWHSSKFELFLIPHTYLSKYWISFDMAYYLLAYPCDDDFGGQLFEAHYMSDYLTIMRVRKQIEKVNKIQNILGL